jgi:hypothetical protein
MVHELALSCDGARGRNHAQKYDVTLAALKRGGFADEDVVLLECFRANSVQETASDKTPLLISDKANNTNAPRPTERFLCLVGHEFNHINNLVTLDLIHLANLAPIAQIYIDQ